MSSLIEFNEEYLNSNKSILAVGLICLDIVVNCDGYPGEDSDQRCQSVQWRRGGNAANNCSVFTQLGTKCEFLGTMGCDYVGKFLKTDLEEHNIPHQNSVLIENSENPTSCVLINSQNGSRTILHSRKNFPELQLKDFMKIDLSNYKWVHFEGRNCDEVKGMISQVTQWRSEQNVILPVSIELEKAKPERMALIPYGDFVFVDKDFAIMCGYTCMQSAVEGLALKVRTGAVIICAWGEKGACAKIAPDGETVSSSSYPPPKVRDTLGAGDTFVASTIVFLAKNPYRLQDAISFGCLMAGAKCGFQGFQGLDLVRKRLGLGHPLNV